MKFASTFAFAALFAPIIGTASAARAAAIFGDDFTVGATSISADTTGTSVSSTPVVLPNGFKRTVKIVDPTFAVEGLDSINAKVFLGSGGLYDYSATAGADAKTVLEYGPNDQTTVSPVFNPTEGFKIDFVALDAPIAGPTSVQVILNPFTGAREYDSQTVLLTTGGAQSVIVPFTGLAANYRADQIQVIIDSPTGADYRLDGFSTVTVPEPATLGLIAAGGLLALRRRRA